MREAYVTALDVHDTGRDRPLDVGVGVRRRRAQQLEVGVRERRDDQQRRAHAGGKPSEPIGDEIPQGRRHGKRLAGGHRMALEGSRELQSEERIAARRRMNLQQPRARRRDAIIVTLVALFLLADSLLLGGPPTS